VRETVTPAPKPQLQLSQVLFTRTVPRGDERIHGNTAADGIGKGSLHFALIEAENRDFDNMPGSRNPFDQRPYPVSGLY
jgi:hypothetical protein